MIKDKVNLIKEFILILIIIFTCIIIIYSSFLLPIIISIIISYLLENVKESLKRYGLSNNISFILIYCIFLTVFFIILFIILPYIFKQLVILFNDLPFLIQKTRFLTYKLIEKYPMLFSSEQTNILFSNIITYVQSIGKTIISASLLSIAIMIKWALYTFIIPILVFFLMKDKIKIIKWFKLILPKKFKIFNKIWEITNIQISNYIRGKLIEAIIMICANYVLFKYYNLSYSVLLSFAVGISVIIPYVGTIIVSIPVLLISIIELGTSNDFIYIVVIYTIIQFLDGNLFVPILFSEVVSLHPISIIISIIIFGSIFGLYGIFFAIPLAILIKVIIKLYLSPDKSLNNT